jgi:hypothetical protein
MIERNDPMLLRDEFPFSGAATLSGSRNIVAAGDLGLG